MRERVRKRGEREREEGRKDTDLKIELIEGVRVVLEKWKDRKSEGKWERKRNYEDRIEVGEISRDKEKEERTRERGR